MGRLERAQRRLRRLDGIRETIRHYESLCLSNEKKVLLWQERLADSRKRLADARNELRNSSEIRQAIEAKLDEMRAEDTMVAKAKKVREALKELGIVCPDTLDKLADRGD